MCHAASRPELCVHCNPSQRQCEQTFPSTARPVSGPRGPRHGAQAPPRPPGPQSGPPGPAPEAVVEQKPCFRVSPPGPGEPTPREAESPEHSRDRHSGPARLAARPRHRHSLGKGGPGPSASPRLPCGLFSTHCLLSLHGPTVIRSRSPASCAPLLCTTLPGCSNH